MAYLFLNLFNKLWINMHTRFSYNFKIIYICINLIIPKIDSNIYSYHSIILLLSKQFFRLFLWLFVTEFSKSVNPNLNFWVVYCKGRRWQQTRIYLTSKFNGVQGYNFHNHTALFPVITTCLPPLLLLTLHQMNWGSWWKEFEFQVDLFIRICNRRGEGVFHGSNGWFQWNLRWYINIL